ncbi:multidrug effflux MFS transporter [Tundrisphaera sp. TA3]|uniref:multidrug effflux MFS transporter n=1 Tax=Tundrisphaera sp. TA3 TaxID=3435775 RepID=UPI003EBFF915
MPLDQPASPSPRSGFRFILLLGLLDAFGPLGIDMYLPAFASIERDLGVRGGAMPLTLSMFLAGLAVGQLICGPISDRVGRRKPLLYGAAAFALASATCAFAGSIGALILARFAMGLAGATGMVIARAVVRDSFEEADSARIYSMLMLVIGIAPIISPSVGAWLMGLGGWGSIFWALAGFACLCGVAVAVDLPETHPPDRRSRDSLGVVFRQYGELIVDPRFMGYAAPVSLALGIIFAYVGSAPSMFTRYYGLSPWGFNLAFASIAIGLIGSAQVNRWLTRRFDTHAILRAACLANAASAALVLTLAWSGWGGFPACFAAIFACLSTVGLILPNATAAAMAPFPHRAGVASALVGALQFTVGAGTGAVVALFHDGTPRPMAATMAGCAAISLAVALVAERRNAHQPGSAPIPAAPGAIQPSRA